MELGYLWHQMTTLQEELVSSEKKNASEVREQIQEDILSFASVIDDEKLFFNESVLDELCGIVVKNFRDLEPCPKLAIAREFVEEVERRAEDKMLKTGKLEGAHYASMKQVLGEWEMTESSSTPQP